MKISQKDKTITKKLAVIYCRVSTKEQVDDGNSLSTQEKICREYALKHGYEIAEVFIEQGQSAKTIDRTELDRLLKFCSVKRNNVSVVISYKIDRISRNTDDYSYIRIELKRYGVEIKSTSEHFENNPSGRFMENIIANVAQFDNDVRTERSVGGMRDATREGRYVWTAPLGYDNLKVGGKSTIGLNPHTAPIVRNTFLLISQSNGSLEDIRKSMSSNGLLNKAGKPLSKSYFYTMLRNRLYTGWIYKFGEKHKGLFEPLISEELFNHVQWKLKGRTHNYIQYNVENPDFPLRRFTYHPDLGLRLTGSWSKGRNNRFPYYRFIGKGYSFSKTKLEAKFMDYMDSFSFDGNNLKELKKKIRDNYINKTEKERKDISLLKKQIEIIQDEIYSLNKKHDKGLISDQVLKLQSERLEKDLVEANVRVVHQPEYNENIEQLLEFVQDYLKAPSKIWVKSSFDIKRRLQWFQFPKGITFDGERFGTAKICSVFRIREPFLGLLSSRVRSGIQITNTSEIPNLTKDDIVNETNWYEVAGGIEEVYNILEGNPTKDIDRSG